MPIGIGGTGRSVRGHRPPHDLTHEQRLRLAGSLTHDSRRHRMHARHQILGRLEFVVNARMRVQRPLQVLCSLRLPGRANECTT